MSVERSNDKISQKSSNMIFEVTSPIASNTVNTNRLISLLMTKLKMFALKQPIEHAAAVVEEDIDLFILLKKRTSNIYHINFL